MCILYVCVCHDLILIAFIKCIIFTLQETAIAAILTGAINLKIFQCYLELLHGISPLKVHYKNNTTVNISRFLPESFQTRSTPSAVLMLYQIGPCNLTPRNGLCETNLNAMNLACFVPVLCSNHA